MARLTKTDVKEIQMPQAIISNAEFELSDSQVMKKYWLEEQWDNYAQRLYEQKMAELSTGLYDPKPYIRMRVAIFALASLSWFAGLVATIYMFSYTDLYTHSSALLAVFMAYSALLFFATNSVFPSRGRREPKGKILFRR